MGRLGKVNFVQTSKYSITLIIFNGQKAANRLSVLKYIIAKTDCISRVPSFEGTLFTIYLPNFSLFSFVCKNFKDCYNIHHSLLQAIRLMYSVRAPQLSNG